MTAERIPVLCTEPRCDLFGESHDVVALDESTMHLHSIDLTPRWSVTVAREDDDAAWAIAASVGGEIDLDPDQADLLAAALLRAADFCRAAPPALEARDAE
ncbi:hypothetical protein [Schumannella sp. 10F1B-5-1]|uniref:hypothetical protein n=1 Tax=Schumannella sp. 10F1B-5-1 TaxID=2590780 RepID=UPI0011323BCF|nr:hypothetical protein [Schumannella sp. 10F1B-5-1]TPW76836.1 hypothetical protein FJ658_02560 [Schumannella sp. 10F1B-5-1]